MPTSSVTADAPSKLDPADWPDDIADRDRWVSAGIWLVGITAAVVSWAGWVILGDLSGFGARILAPDALPVIGGRLAVRLSYLLPLTVDVYALVAARVWLRVPYASERTRRYARRSTVVAIVLGVVGNAGGHAMTAYGVQHAPLLVVIAVSALAPVMLGLVAHLAALVAEDRKQVGRDSAGLDQSRRREPDGASDHRRDSRDADGAGEPIEADRHPDGGTDSGTNEPCPDVPRDPGDEDNGGPASTAGNQDQRDRDANQAPPVHLPQDRSPAEHRMWAAWREALNGGTVLCGAELDRAAGTNDYGRRILRGWAAEGLITNEDHTAARNRARELSRQRAGGDDGVAA